MPDSLVPESIDRGGRIARRPRWQFGMKTMLLAMLLGGPLLAAIWQSARGARNYPRVVPCEGMVTWADGSPVAAAIVCFQKLGSDSLYPLGVTGADGSFALTAWADSNGKLSEDYVVRVFEPGSQFAALSEAADASPVAELTVTVSHDQQQNFFHLIVQ